MNRYLAVFTGSPDAMARWATLPDAERQKRQTEGVAAWKKWATDNSAAIVEMGEPLSRTRLISAAGITDVSNNLTGNLHRSRGKVITIAAGPAVGGTAPYCWV